jgi:hypothetical protein
MYSFSVHTVDSVLAATTNTNYFDVCGTDRTFWNRCIVVRHCHSIFPAFQAGYCGVYGQFDFASVVRHYSR